MVQARDYVKDLNWNCIRNGEEGAYLRKSERLKLISCVCMGTMRKTKLERPG